MSPTMKLLALCLAWPALGVNVRFRRGFLPELRQDALFGMTWIPKVPAGAKSATAHVASENCKSFAGQEYGFNCYIEAPEHALAHRWIPANATVMEFGARFGTTTCELAKKLENSGRLLTIEPDQSVWGYLESNIKSHNCHAHVLRGAVSSSPLHMISAGYGGRSGVDTDKGNVRGSGVTVPTFSFDQVEKALGLKFDTLLIDCEGCAQDMMDQIGPKIQSQIKLIVIEADMPDTGGDCTSHCMNYKKFFDFLDKSGFEKVDEFNDCDRTRSGAPEGTWCGPWIQHYAFRRRGSA